MRRQAEHHPLPLSGGRAGGALGWFGVRTNEKGVSVTDRRYGPDEAANTNCFLYVSAIGLFESWHKLNVFRMTPIDLSPMGALE
jgi:hypothetical protein